MSFKRGALYKLNTYHCYGQRGRVQVTESIAQRLGITHGEWWMRTQLQTLAADILGPDAIIRERGGEKHRRVCPECKNALLHATGNILDG